MKLGTRACCCLLGALLVALRPAHLARHHAAHKLVRGGGSGAVLQAPGLGARHAPP
jgi:hypothetical protein